MRGALALLSGLLLAGTSLGLTAPAAGAAVADPGAVPAAPAAAEDFQQVTLAKGEPEVGEPMSPAVLPDRSVLPTSRDGELRVTDAAGNTKLEGRLAVYSHAEEGLQGVGIDPGFADNRFMPVTGGCNNFQDVSADLTRVRTAESLSDWKQAGPGSFTPSEPRGRRPGVLP